jgi:membrane protein implicated in regulation of membrane protease activity
MESSINLKAYRYVAYSAVTFAVVSVLTVCVTMPMVYNFVHQTRRQMQQELADCKVRSFATETKKQF